MSNHKSELLKMDLNQLRERLDDYRRDLFQLKLKSSTSVVGDTSQFKKLRKNIAQTLTFIKQKEKSK